MWGQSVVSSCGWAWRGRAGGEPGVPGGALEKPCGEFFSGAVDAGFDGFGGAVEDGGNLLVRLVMVHREDQCGALVFGELQEGLFDAFLQFGCSGLLVGLCAGIWQGVAKCGKALAREKRFTTSFTKGVDRGIAGNLEEPGGKAGAFEGEARGANGLIGPHEDALGDILRFVRIGNHPVYEGQDRALEFFHELFKGCFIAGTDLFHTFRVRWHWQHVGCHGVTVANEGAADQC